MLQILAEAQRERGGRGVPMVMLYGRVVEKVDVSPQELMDMVKRLIPTFGPEITARSIDTWSQLLVEHQQLTKPEPIAACHVSECSTAPVSHLSKCDT